MFVPVLLLAIVVVISAVIVSGRRLLSRHLGRRPFAFGGFLRALLPMIFPSVEDQMQPGHHLFDRRQRTRRARFAQQLRACLAAWPSG